MSYVKRLSANLRRRRGDLSQEKFAKKLGVSIATVNRLESGSQNITLKTLEQITKALKCDIGDLFD